jgi:S-methyl-1-thioxylulose 5-phosphate methylthiotransferase
VTEARRREEEPLRWEGVEVLAYKPDGQDTFRDLSRQVLFDREDLACQVRLFEVEPGGHTTLERHQHAHAVIVLRGRGQCLVGDEVIDLRPYDLVEVRPWQWHQFRAAADDHLGFVCIVNQDRDRPQLPTDDELRGLAADPAVNAFLDLG